MSERIKAELTDGVYTITLDNPDKLNCIGWDMLESLGRCIEEAENKIGIKVLVIKGAGDKAFSSGADLKEFGSLTASDAKRWIITGNKLFNRIDALPKPTLAVLKGYVIGGGLELALSCDFRICADDAVFSFPEVMNGWLPGWGGLARLKRLIGESQAKKFILMGDKVKATDLQSSGLITELTGKEDLADKVNEYINKLKKIKPFVYELAKTSLHEDNRKTEGADLLFDVLALNRGND